MSSTKSTKLSTAIWRLLFRTIQFLWSKLLAFVYRSPTQTIPTTKNSVLMESATSLASRIRNKKVTSTEVVEAFIDRIKEINSVLNCIAYERFENALKDAAAVDELINSGDKDKEELESETPLLGVPFTISVSIVVKGFPQSAGFWNETETPSDEDTELVSMLRKAGAIPLACTNISEACASMEANNPLFGRTRNPYNTHRTTGGACGGEAALIASSGSPLGISSDCEGSLRLSSAFSGIFCHKPSAGLSPPDGLILAGSESYTVLGPMSKSSEDLLSVLKIISRKAEADLKLNEPVDVKKIKYYVLDSDGGIFSTPVEKDIQEAIQKVADHFQNSHRARVERVCLGKMKDAFFMAMAKKEKSAVDHFKKAALKGADKFSLSVELMKSFGGFSHHTSIFLMTLWVEDRLREWNKAKRRELIQDCYDLSKELERLLGSDGVLLYPTYPTGAYYHNESPTRTFDMGYSSIFNALGLPATHCPMGLNSADLPIGFQVVAAANQDRLTLAVAKEVDKVFGGWKPPPTHGTFTMKNTVFHQSNNKIRKIL